jgi:glycosyltransferase involved in cell wall biosynthesis
VRIPAHWARSLNGKKCVIVPCRDNAKWFRLSGVTAPIRVVPLGIDPAIYHPEIPEPADVFRVGCAGRVGAQGDRKRLGLVARLFVEAFPIESYPECQLEIKCWPGCAFEVANDSRIAINREVLSDAGLAEWYRSLSVFASASLGEGWGLQPHQAMACGRPTIAPFWGGHADYMTEETSWSVDYSEPHHCHIEESSMVARLRESYHDLPGRIAKGKAAAIRAAEFTWKRSARQLAEVVREFGLHIQPEEARIRLAMRVELCPHGSGPCGCGDGPPRLCAHPDHPAEVRRAYCLECPEPRSQAG